MKQDHMACMYFSVFFLVTPKPQGAWKNVFEELKQRKATACQTGQISHTSPSGTRDALPIGPVSSAASQWAARRRFQAQHLLEVSAQRAWQLAPLQSSLCQSIQMAASWGHLQVNAMATSAANTFSGIAGWWWWAHLATSKTLCPRLRSIAFTALMVSA